MAGPGRLDRDAFEVIDLLGAHREHQRIDLLGELLADHRVEHGAVAQLDPRVADPRVPCCAFSVLLGLVRKPGPALTGPGPFPVGSSARSGTGKGSQFSTLVGVGAVATVSP